MAVSAFLYEMNKTYVYVDAFNLYYGAVRNTNLKWLNINKMCELLLPLNSIIRIKYFTAEVGARSNDLNQPVRQQIYFRALKTIPHLKIYRGHFLTQTHKLRLVNPIKNKTHAVVFKDEEKGSDVNLAVHLLNDAYRDVYDTAVIISNDSDLYEAIRIIKNQFTKIIGVLNPHKYPSKKLLEAIDFYKPIRKGVLRNSQFSSKLSDKNGNFHKPEVW